MPPYHFFNPMGFGIEFIYTLIVVFLCFLIYQKTKSIYDLTKHKGIAYFRTAFLLFGISYAIGFILHLSTFTSRLIFDVFLPRRTMFPLIIVLVGYLSTMAIFYLSYSTVWKKIRYDHFITFSNIIAVTLSLIAFISRSHILLSLLQLILLVSALILSSKKHKKSKKKSNTRTLYLLIALFWLINLFLAGPRRLLPLEIKVLLQIISLGVFFTIYYKVTKWIK